MKVNLSILIYSLASGGAERVVSILLNEMKNDFDITLFLMNNEVFYKIPKDIKIVKLEDSRPNESGIIKFMKLPVLGWKYKKLNKSSSISLSFMNRANYINILAKMFGMNSKIFISERSVTSKEYRTNKLKDITSRFIVKSLYFRADKIISNSNGILLDLVNNFNLPINKIIVINNPINLNLIKLHAKNKINFRDDDFTFITIGRIDSGKNHILLINSMKNINAKLYIIGDGELKKSLCDKVLDEKIGHKVIFLGKKKNPYKYLRQSDCFVFSSNHEGFPNVILEALACGLPVISTDCMAGPREILAPKTDLHKLLCDDIELAEYGVLTAVNNERSMTEAMKLMMNNKKLRRLYSEKALERANCFRVERIMRHYFNLLYFGN